MSREDGEQLEFEVDFLGGVLERNRNNIECLRVLAHNYTRMGRHKQGLSLDRRLAQLCPADPIVHYNLACSYSCTGRLERSIEELSQAVSLGYRDFEYMKNDPDLAAVRQTEEFENLLERESALS